MNHHACGRNHVIFKIYENWWLRFANRIYVWRLQIMFKIQIQAKSDFAKKKKKINTYNRSGDLCIASQDYNFDTLFSMIDQKLTEFCDKL